MYKDKKKIEQNEVTEFQSKSIASWSYDIESIKKIEPKNDISKSALVKFYSLNGSLPDVHRTNGRRVYSPLTAMRRDMRKHITYKGESLIEIDTANSHPLIMVNHLLQANFEVEPALKYIVESGTFYDIFITNDNPRNQVKIQWFQFCYNKEINVKNPIYMKLNELYPQFTKSLCAFSEQFAGHPDEEFTLAKMLQQIEADIWISKISWATTKALIAHATIHDSIVFPGIENINKILDIIEAAFGNIEPSLHIKTLDGNDVKFQRVKDKNNANFLSTKFNPFKIQKFTKTSSGEANPIKSAINLIKNNYKEGQILFNNLNKSIVIEGGKTIDSIYIDLKERNINITKSDLYDLIKERIAIKYDPIEQYFDKMLQDYTFDQVEGSITNFCKYIDAENNDLFDSMFRKHLIRCVGQGRKQLTNRFVFVIQQLKQYTGKSEWIKNLNPFGSELYVESIDDQNPILTLSQSFMINLEELESFNKNDVNKIKALISKSHDQIRVYFTQVNETRERVGSYWGSTNKVEFLDDSENTRWITLTINSINFDYNNWHTGEGYDINKVWAEAAYLWKQNASYEPTADEWNLLAETNKSFTYYNDHDHWVEEYLIPTDEEEEYLTTATKIAQYLKDNRTGATPQKVGAALRKAGYLKVQKRIGTEIVKGYYVMTKNGKSIFQEMKEKNEEEIRKNESKY